MAAEDLPPGAEGAVPTRVTCYSGHRYAQEPRTFTWCGETVAVARVVRAWREPAGPAFLVEDPSGRRWRLRYAEAEDAWLCQKAPRPQGTSRTAPEPQRPGGDATCDRS